MRYDVAVIGAGPAGSFAAERLSSLGHRTLIIDPCDRKKVCAGILTAQYARKYRIDKTYLERELKGVRLSFGDIKAEITYKNAVEYSIDRASYDSFNLEEAIEAGTKLKKESVLSIEEKGSYLVIRMSKEHVFADYAIVAAGVSDLSRTCGGADKYVFCVQQKKALKPGDYFEMNLTSGGYSWSAPKKDHVLTGTSSRTGYPDIPGEKGMIPLGPVRKTYSERYLLAGDAAGFVSPFESEGIYYDRRSSEIAAKIISGAIAGKNTLPDYETCWKKEFDFSALDSISRMLSNDMILKAFVRAVRDDERFNKLMEGILIKEDNKYIE